MLYNYINHFKEFLLNVWACLYIELDIIFVCYYIYISYIFNYSLYLKDILYIIYNQNQFKNLKL